MTTGVVIKQHYQDSAVAANYDRQRFSPWAGRVFNYLEKRALRCVVHRALSQCRTADVLDVACGTGRITELLLDMGLNVTGADISEQMMDVARQRCQRFGQRAAFRRLDLDHPDLPDNSFELVTCIRLFHHLDTDDRRRILAGLARITRRFVLVNVSLSSPAYRLRRRIKRWLGQGTSRACSTWSDIHGEATAAGLTLRSHRFVMRYGSEDLVLLLEKT